MSFKTYHTELLQANAPIDSYAERAVRDQCNWLLDNAQENITKEVVSPFHKIIDKVDSPGLHLEKQGFICDPKSWTVIASMPIQIKRNLKIIRVIINYKLETKTFSPAPTPSSFRIRLLGAQAVSLAVTSSSGALDQVREFEISFLNPSTEIYQDTLVIEALSGMTQDISEPTPVVFQVQPVTNEIVQVLNMTNNVGYELDSPDYILELASKSNYIKGSRIGNASATPALIHIYNPRIIPQAIVQIRRLILINLKSFNVSLIYQHDLGSYRDIRANIPVSGATHFDHEQAVDLAYNQDRMVKIGPDADLAHVPLQAGGTPQDQLGDVEAQRPFHMWSLREPALAVSAREQLALLPLTIISTDRPASAIRFNFTGIFYSDGAGAGETLDWAKQRPTIELEARRWLFSAGEWVAGTALDITMQNVISESIYGISTNVSTSQLLFDVSAHTNIPDAFSRRPLDGTWRADQIGNQLVQWSVSVPLLVAGASQDGLNVGISINMKDWATANQTYATTLFGSNLVRCMIVGYSAYLEAIL